MHLLAQLTKVDTLACLGQYFIDIKVSLPYTPFSRKQVFIKSRTSTSRLTASGSKVLYHFAFNCTISGKT